MLCEINIKVMLILHGWIGGIDIILHGWVGGIEKFAHVVVIFSNHECGNIFQYPSQAAKPRVMGIGKYYH